MFLKTLTLKGFKSFADTTVLEFEPGVTVVVGPNGSGKSNVVDAIGWVLGAQAPSVVRSQRMDDVIFVGSAQRAALGRAEVALTIDNSAGVLPIEFGEVTITRTLFRTGESEYSINGVPCRLLDVLELLSDAGVGRQQHVIVSQGQIDAVLNARSEDRRFIIEEAAGVLKFRKRREKAERRLAASEANLVRLGDLLSEVRRQLRPLERQAAAARAHQELAGELTSLKLFLAGRELSALRRRLAEAGEARGALAEEEERHRRELADLDERVAAAQAGLSRGGGEGLAGALARCESLRERARGLAAVLAERQRGIDRERDAIVDEGVIAALAPEAERLGVELAEIDREVAALAPQAGRLADEEAALAEARSALGAQRAGGAAPSAGRAAGARGELAALRAGDQRGQAELDRSRRRLAALEERLARVGAEQARWGTALAEAEAGEAPLREGLAASQRARSAAETRAGEAESVMREAEAERHAWAARAEALACALEQARARAGAGRLASAEGALGALAELVEVDPGWEAAVQAAAGEAMWTMVVGSVDAARAALAALARDEAHGAVLALGPATRARQAGWAGPPVAGCEPVRSHVRAAGPGVDPSLEPLLDVLFGEAVAVGGGWAAAVDVAVANPGAVVVTFDGDRLGPSGWRIGAAQGGGGGEGGATTAALEDARRRAEAATARAAQAEASLRAARSSLEQARQAEAAALRRLDANGARLAAASEALELIAADRRDAAGEAESLAQHAAELAERLARERSRAAELERLAARLEADEADAASNAAAISEAKDRLAARAAELAASRSELDARSAGLEHRRASLSRRLVEVEQRLAAAVAAQRQVQARHVDLDSRQAAVDRLARLVGRLAATLDRAAEDLGERHRRQRELLQRAAARLEELRRDRAGAERRLEATRERARRVELDQAEVGLRLEAALDALRRDLDVEPELALATPPPELPAGVTPAGRARELERELRLMGPVNPLALEEHAALQERHQFLQDQVDDVRATRRELAKVIRAIDEEIVSVFAAAFADVSHNFEALFATLFPGGTGKLRLTAPDDLLNTGIEVEAKPSGKNVRKLSLLSGGERSLTALAFLFAVFRSRPSPFYVLDEVEAALDDVNLHRFLELVHEFRSEAQLMIVSHQKRTMEAADCLYGVTIAPDGASKVVSERVGAGAPR